MRGIQINNYFNNHITLNGKKISNEGTAVVHTHRPKPLIVNHVHPSTQPQYLSESKSPHVKAANTFHKKKRVNTLVEIKTRLKKRSISLQKLVRHASASKKLVLGSCEEDKEDTNLIDISQKRMKNTQVRGGLEKRSKSTIIRPVAEIKENAKCVEFSSKNLVQPYCLKSSPTKIKSVHPIKEKIPQLKKQISFLKVPSSILKTKKAVDSSLKSQKFCSAKKSARSHNNVQSKSGISSNKQSKPTSARDRKKIPKKKLFAQKQFNTKNEINREILASGQFQNLAANQVQMSIKILQPQDEDLDFVEVVNNLQTVLNRVTSKQKLKKELTVITEKLRALENPIESSEERQSSNQNLQSRMHENGDKDQRHSHYQGSSNEEASEVKEVQIFKDGQSQLHLDQEFINPILGRREKNGAAQIEGFVISDEQLQNDRKREIALLKMFKLESSKMMEKINTKSVCATVSKTEISGQVVDQTAKNKANETIILETCPKDNSAKLNLSTDDRYPSSTLSVVKSPKFSDNYLMGMISMKEQFIMSKHEKMSQLVQKMFEKQIVSPKSFDFQMLSLRNKFEQDNETLESCKKQAEQLSSILLDINKDKEQIKDIDELIRNQKWQEAHQLIENASKQGVWEQITIQPQMERNRARNNSDVRIHIDKSSTSQSEDDYIGIRTNMHNFPKSQTPPNENQECIYYNGDEDQHPLTQVERQDCGFKLIKVFNEDEIKFSRTQKAQSIAEGGEQASFCQAKAPKSQLEQSPQGMNALMSSPTSQKGFDTNIYFIREYCIALCEYVRENKEHTEDFKSSINLMVQYDERVLLKLFRTNLKGEATRKYNSKVEELAYVAYQKKNRQNIISESIFKQFNEGYEALKYSNSLTASHLDKDLEHVFLKSIFQALNESLSQERPGGVDGKALPWSKQSKHLKNLKYKYIGRESGVADDLKAGEEYDLIFGVAIARICQWASFLCGFLADTAELENTEIDEDYMARIRDGRMAFLLQKSVVDDDILMNNRELQELQVTLQLCESIYNQLIEEFYADAHSISSF